MNSSIGSDDPWHLPAAAGATAGQESGPEAGASAATDYLWPCLAAARQTRGAGRCAVRLMQPGGPVQVGSVAREHLAALRDWPALFGADDQDGGITLRLPEHDGDAVLAEVHARLRAAGLIRAWRDEPFALFGPAGEVVAVIERAAARFWGALTLGAHCNGYLLDGARRPSHLWVARRALDKPTDPGLLDNLIGSGVPWGQTPRQSLVREAWEEAGLTEAQVHGLRAGNVIEVDCDVPEGRQREWLHVYDLCLPAGVTPVNQDGEVAEHRLLPMAQALALAASGRMTTDASLATLDFALRHRLLPQEPHERLSAALQTLRVPAALAGRFDHPGGEIAFNSTEATPQSG